MPFGRLQHKQDEQIFSFFIGCGATLWLRQL